MSRLSISVVIPTFNRPKGLQRALESIREQSRPPDEIVVAVNGMNRETEDLLQRWSGVFGTLKLVGDSQVVAPVVNWRRAVEAASGDFVKVVWDDDWLDPQCIEALGHVADRLHPPAIICAAYGEIGGQTYVWYADVPSGCYSAAQTVNFVASRAWPRSPLAGLHRRDDLLEAMDFTVWPPEFVCDEFAAGPDLAMMYWGVLRGDGVCFLNQPLVHMYGGQDSMSMREPARVERAYEWTLDRMVSNFGIVRENPKSAVSRRINHRAFASFWNRVKRKFNG